MKYFTKVFSNALCLGLLTSAAAHAQQTIGSSTAPGSTLDVRGSLAANYLQVTTASYTLLSTDFYVVYANNTASGSFTLPAANTNTISTATTNYKGRVYTVKNASAAQTLTISPAGGETIDGNASLSVPAGQSVQLMSTGASSGATWEIVAFAAATSAGAGAGTTASNGLTATSGNVQLGGTLLRNTDVATAGFSQTFSGTGSVGVGTAAPNANAALDVSGTTKGLLLPRLALTSTAAAAPLAAHVAGMLVYNTATVGDVSAGLYENDGTRWVKLVAGGGVPSSLGIGDSYVYSGSIPYGTWTDNSYLNNYPTITTLPTLPIVEGLQVTAQLNGSNSLYRPYFRNTTAAPLTYTFNARASVDGFTTGANQTLPVNTNSTSATGYSTYYDDVFLSTTRSEVEQVDLAINNKWYRILYFFTLDSATTTGSYTIRIQITRLL